MVRAIRRNRWLATIKRILVWNPQNYWQVWLSAADCGVGMFIIRFAVGRLLVGIVADWSARYIWFCWKLST
jgi:hypothetical protein